MSERLQTDAVEDVSAAFELLCDARRRGVLYTASRDGETDVGDIARRIARWQSDGVTPDSVETSLVHVHLPKLDDAGVVDHDREAGTVTLTDRAARLEPLLRVTREREPTLFRAVRTPAVDTTGEA